MGCDRQDLIKMLYIERKSCLRLGGIRNLFNVVLTLLVTDGFYSHLGIVEAVIKTVNAMFPIYTM